MGQERDHGLVVGGGVEAGEREKRLDLRREDKGAGRHAVIEGLDPQAIPRAKQPPAHPIPNGEGEHPVEPGETILSPVAVGLQQDFRVGPRLERVAERLELRPQLEMVVDLTIEHDPLSGIARHHRLQTTVGEIDDGQASVPQPDSDGRVCVPVRGVRQEGVMPLAGTRPAEQEPLAVRSAVHLQIVHAL